MNKKLLFLLVLLLTATMSTWAQTETLLTTITPTAKEQASYSTANVATVSFSYTAGGSSAYLANWGWWGYGWIATVTAAEGYTITKCIFYDDADRTATDSEAPFVVKTTDEDKTPRINGTPIDGGNMQSKGIKKIEVYGYVTPTYSVTLAEGTEDANKWTISPTEAAEGSPVTATYSGEKKVKSVKAVKKASAYTQLSAATAEDIGKVVCAAGHLHDAKTAVPDGCTAVGILGKVTETGNGLILALQDAAQQTWNTINGWTSASYAGTTLKVLPDDAARGANLTSYTTLGATTVSNWAVAQKSDYEAIFTNLGSTTGDEDGMTFDDNVNAYITGVGGTALETGSRAWSISTYNDTRAWQFTDTFWGYGKFDLVRNVRPVLGFGEEATPGEAANTWTFQMPANNVELQVEYYAESNLFLSKDALADKANIAVTAGELGVQFGDDGKSANTITEGTPMTVKFNGTKKVLGVKVEKKPEPLIVNPVVGQIIGSDGKNYDANATLPDGVKAVAMIAYVGNDAETSTTYNHGLALALENVSGAKVWCYQTDATCLGTQYDGGTKINDLSGIANTDALVNHTGHTHEAASAARNYNSGTHPAGTSAWFLPSAGQWYKMVTAAGDYATLKTNAGLQSSSYWSSTESGADKAWRFSFSNGGWNNASKVSALYVRACLAF